MVDSEVTSVFERSRTALIYFAVVSIPGFPDHLWLFIHVDGVAEILIVSDLVRGRIFCEKNEDGWSLFDLAWPCLGHCAPAGANFARWFEDASRRKAVVLR